MRIFHNLILYLLIWWMQHGGNYLFKIWIELESQKEKVINSAQGEGDFPTQLLEYLYKSTKLHWKWYQDGDWALLVRLFYVCILKSPQVELPIMSPSHEKYKEESWEYQERTWHLYSHLLAKSYGWTLEYIANLPVIEVLAKIQEIIVDDQLEKEFYYGLSEMAYAYDKNTKKSRFVPLPRPSWMRPRIEPEKIKRFKIPAKMLPTGIIIVDGVLPEELMPKEIH